MTLNSPRTSTASSTPTGASEGWKAEATTGAEAAPASRLIPVGSHPSARDLDAIPGDRVVLKIVSPDITHKTEAHGVRIVANEIGAVEAAHELMLRQVPEVYGAWLERHEGEISAALNGLTGRDLQDRLRERLVGRGQLPGGGVVRVVSRRALAQPEPPEHAATGGQRQALTMLMATLVRPEVLLLDEHIAALDPKTAGQILSLTREIVAEQGLTTLMITHNMKHAIEFGNRLIMLHQGRIILDVSGEKKRSLSVDDLLHQFYKVQGEELANDSMLLT